MEIGKLKTFIDLSKTLNFSETAANLYITQSSVSKHIRSLEREIGKPIFIRNNKHVALSPYGKAMIPYIKQILISYNEMYLALNKLEAQRKNQITLGTIPTFSNYKVFQEVTTYLNEHPDIQIVLKECETTDIYNYLLNNKIDLAFVRKIDKLPAAFDTIKIKKESFKIYLSKDDDLAQKNVVNIKDLKERNFITLNRNSLLQEPIIKLCERAGFEPQITFVSNRVNSILEMVKRNQGIAIMMDSLPRMEGVVARQILPTVESELMFIKKKTLNFKWLNGFWDYLKSNHAKME